MCAHVCVYARACVCMRACVCVCARVHLVMSFLAFIHSKPNLVPVTGTFPFQQSMFQKAFSEQLLARRHLTCVLSQLPLRVWTRVSPASRQVKPARSEVEDVCPAAARGRSANLQCHFWAFVTDGEERAVLSSSSR